MIQPRVQSVCRLVVGWRLLLESGYIHLLFTIAQKAARYPKAQMETRTYLSNATRILICSWLWNVKLSRTLSSWSRSGAWLCVQLQRGSVPTLIGSMQFSFIWQIGSRISQLDTFHLTQAWNWNGNFFVLYAVAYTRLQVRWGLVWCLDITLYK